MRSQKTSLYNDTFLRIGSLCICLTALIGTSFLGMKLHGISDHQNRFFYAWRDSLSAGTDSLCIPTNIHLAPITNVDLKSHMMNMTLSFTLPEECSPSTTTTVIRYGYNETTFLTQSNETFQFTYTAFVRSYESSWIHHAVLKDLRAGEELYWYQIQAWKNEESSSTQSNSSVIVFSTPPLPLEAVSIALIGDWGGSPEAVRTMQRMTNVSLVVVAGDISYANSNLPLWEDWLRIMQPLLAQTPLLVAAGNHEIECNRETFQVFQAYESYFRNPNRIGPPHLEPIPRQFADCTHPAEFETTYWYGNSFYSYRHGLLQIIVLNSYTDTSKESVQYQWLQKELERVNRTVTPWLLIVFHCPFHTTFRGHNGKQVMWRDFIFAIVISCTVLSVKYHS